MRVLVLPRSINAQEFSGSTAQIDDKGRITLGGFVFSEAPLFTNLLKYSDGDKYVQLVYDSVLAPSSSSPETTKLILPDHKNSISTSRKVDWVTPYLKSGYYSRMLKESSEHPHMQLRDGSPEGKCSERCEPKPTKAKTARKIKL